MTSAMRVFTARARLDWLVKELRKRDDRIEARLGLTAGELQKLRARLERRAA